MKTKIEEFLLIDELNPKVVLFITLGAAATLRIGHWVVFAEFMWWLK